MEDVTSTSYAQMTSADSGESIFSATITAGQSLAGTAPTSPVRLMTLQIGIALNSSTGGQERAAVMATLLLLFASGCLLAYRATLRRALRWFS